MAESRRLRWCIEDALKRSTLKADARHVLWVLLSIADTTTGVIPEAFTPSYSTLAKATGLGRSTVVERIKDLENGGWLRVQPPARYDQVSKRARNQYVVLLPTGPRLGLVQDTDQSSSRTSPAHGPALVRAMDQ